MIRTSWSGDGFRSEKRFAPLLMLLLFVRRHHPELDRCPSRVSRSTSARSTTSGPPFMAAAVHRSRQHLKPAMLGPVVLLVTFHRPRLETDVLDELIFDLKEALPSLLLTLGTAMHPYTHTSPLPAS